MSDLRLIPPGDMPFSIEAEQSLLGAVFISNDVWWRICDISAAHHFYDPLHRRIYLGLIRSSGAYGGNKVAETEEISQNLKALAKDLDIAIVCLMQLSRQVEGRDNKRPMLSDLRWSGAIEQDADIVIMLYREAYYLERAREPDPDKDYERMADLERCKNIMELIIAKNRNGPNCFTCSKLRPICPSASSSMRMG